MKIDLFSLWPPLSLARAEFFANICRQMFRSLRGTFSGNIRAFLTSHYISGFIYCLCLTRCSTESAGLLHQIQCNNLRPTFGRRKEWEREMEESRKTREKLRWIREETSKDTLDFLMESPGAAMLARNEVKRTNRIHGQARRNAEVKGQEHPMLALLRASKGSITDWKRFMTVRFITSFIIRVKIC